MSESIVKEESKEEQKNNNIDIDTNKKNNKKKEEVPDDQDLINEIKKVENPILKTKLLSLNKLNTDLIDTKQINYKPEYVILRNKYELKYFDVYQKIIDIAVGNNTSDDILFLTKEEMEKYNIKEKEEKEKEKEEKKPIESFFTKAIRNANFFSFNKKDSNILDYLVNIKFIPLENKVDFKVEYYFNKNPYMENEILTKTYYFNLKNERLMKCDYCEIKWADDESNPTKKIKKKVKSGRKNQTVVQDIDSFFNMFYKNKTNLLMDDSEARFLKEDFMPNLLEYYLNFPNYNIKDVKKDIKKK
jgi:hypothetical protein